MSPEWDLVLLTSMLGAQHAGDVDRAERILRGDLDFDRLAALATRHRTAPALAVLIEERGLTGVVPAGFAATVAEALRRCRHRAELLTAEAERVSRLFSDAGVVAAFTKGVIAQTTHYRDLGIRPFGDIDVLVSPAAAEHVRDALLSAGYRWATTYDEATNSLVPLARERQMLYKLNPDHHPHYHRLSGEADLPAYTVDVSFSLTWFTSEWQVPAEEVLHEIDWVPVGGRRLPTLPPAYFLLYTTFHLFRDAWFEWNVREDDLKLSQFADIARQWLVLSPADRAAAAELIAKFGLGAPVGWVTHHLDDLYGTDATAELGLTSAGDDRWLHSARAVDGTFLVWSGDMRDRLLAGAPPNLAAAPPPPVAPWQG
jgi:hypothetical protein